MRIESVVYNINQACDKNDFATARSRINKEWMRVTEPQNYSLLNENAQQLIKIIRDTNQTSDVDILSLDQKRTIQRMNQYVRDMNFPNAKLTYSEHEQLFNLPETQRWLTKDAQIICEALSNGK